MRAGQLLSLVLSGAALVSALPQPQSSDSTDSTNATSTDPPADIPTSASTDPSVALSQLDQLADFAANVTTDNVGNGTTTKRGQCTLANLKVRRNWVSLSSTEKKEYINAVLCLQKKAKRTPDTTAPGVKSRFDDFVDVHINQSFTIHYSGYFLPWHRYFVWEYENALRNECGYTGYQPYWNWAESAATGLENHPVYDGSDTSLSGNGAKIANQGPIEISVPGYNTISFPAGSGGGCVTSGPFQNMQVNLGPGGLVLPTTAGVPDNRPNPLLYNPRCLKRDLSDYVNKRYANATSIVHLILANQHTGPFQAEMEGPPGVDLGVHGGGHFSMGGDPGRDFMVSPSDPAFYFHHAMIDRVWWIWQSLNPTTRYTEVSGTHTMLNFPPSDPITLDDVVDLAWSGPDVPRKFRDLMNTADGPFCYIYA